MKTLLLFFGALLLLQIPVSSNAQSRMTGLVFDDERYDASSRLSPALKFGSNLPASVSLKNFCPAPGDQGQMGSCVGWSTGYAALSIANAVHTNTSSREVITGNARSALYIFNQIKLSDCRYGGAIIEDALDLVKDKGDCMMTDFSPSNCDALPGENHHLAAGKFKIREYYRIFDRDAPADQKITSTINSLAARKPVIIGMNVTSSLSNIPGNAIWQPKPQEEIIGGHAICVTGYDNNSRMFEILNSWGEDWGANGFFYISYDNYARYCKYGYQFVLDAKSPSRRVSLSGAFRFRKLTGYNDATGKHEFSDIAPILQGDSYTFAGNTVRKDDFFRILVSGTKKDNYVYIFSIKPDNTGEILFPISLSADGATVKDLPIVPDGNTSIEIPMDETKGISTDQVGEDYLCILYSDGEIPDINRVVENIRQSSGGLRPRLENELGNRLIPAGQTNYSPAEMSFSAASTTGNIAAIILKVNVAP